ncbi:aromatic acid exporter family protein [Streptomyces ramulosus]
MHHLVGRLRHRRPGRLVHGIKASAAALAAWTLAGPVAPDGRAYVAVATALLMANAATVYRSVTNALQSIGAKVLGLVLALLTVRLLGPTAGAIAVIALLTVLAGPRRTAGGRGQVASTAVVALAVMAGDPMGGLVSPVLQTLVGAAVGIAVNALVLPPLHVDESDSAVRALARTLGELLHDMGAGLAQGEWRSRAHGWLHRGRQLERHLAFAQEQVRQADESLRWNARCVTHGRHADVPPGRRGEVTYGELFHALRGVSLQVRGIARTLADSAYDHRPDRHLGPQFLDRYAETLRLAGAAVRGLVDDPRAEDGRPGPREQLQKAIEEVLAWHETMTDLVGRGALTRPDAWHVYGSLMTDMERLLADLDHVGAR